MPDDRSEKLAVVISHAVALETCDSQSGMLICSAAHRKRVRSTLTARAQDAVSSAGSAVGAADTAAGVQ